MYTEEFLETVERWDGSLLGPSAENKKIEGLKVFKSDFFERYFATAHAILPGLFWGPTVGACIYFTIVSERFDGVLPTAARFGAGLLLWTLVEYLLHRFVFHLEPGKDLDSKIKQFVMHGYHHEFPNHRERLVAPLVLSVPIAVPLAAGCVLVFGNFHWMIWFAGIVTGYIAYDWVHYYTHHFRPTTRIGKFMRRYHMEHHYKDSDSHFGISSPLWDWVFGTARSKADAPRSGGAAITR